MKHTSRGESSRSTKDDEDGKGSIEYSMQDMPDLPDPTEKNSSMRTIILDDEDGSSSRREGNNRRGSFLFAGSNKKQESPNTRRRSSLFGRINNKLGTKKPSLLMGQRLNRMAKNLTTRVLQKKTVRIQERHIQVFGIEHLDDLTLEQIDAVWFNDDEIKEMKRENELAAMAMDDGKANVEGRGLEGHTEQGKWLAFKARMDATNAVLDEQDRQMGRGRRRIVTAKLNHVKIRAIYLEVSEQYGIEAVERGQQDEKEAAQLLADVRREHHKWLARLEEEESAQLITEIEKMYGIEKISGGAASPSLVTPKRERKPRVAFAEITPEQRQPIPEQRPPSPSKGNRRQSWFHDRRSARISASAAGKTLRKQSWFLRAQKSFESTSSTHFTPGVGITVVKN